MFIKKIFEDKADESVHRQFIRFGKGSYENRAILNLRKGENIEIKSSFEYANDFVNFVAQLGGGKVSGVVLRKGAKTMSKDKINDRLDSEQIKELVDNSYFCLVDIEGDGFTLKTKKRLPKPGKSGKTKIDKKFCVLETNLEFWPKVKDAFFWDLPECKKAKISHAYMITNIIIPKDKKDFEKIRLEAKRKGKIIRKIVVDGKEIVREHKFIV